MSSALRRAIQRPADGPADVAERCEMCGLAVPVEHRHVLDVRHGEPRCVCQACALLFERDAAAEGRYRLIPGRRLRVPEFVAADLGVPVGLAFFVRQPGGGVVAHYPSPAGATRWEVEAAAWEAVEGTCPPVREMLPGVQALLVNTARGRREHWLVPIDDCYRLVALIRREWRGLSGGSEVWPAIDGFFADLDE
ncbi:DUF5947 family protein [Amycolatopsis taiwanensis]|uniref:Uncharacterized protein n=1 Tax=Amycolatopsis taiwanensis TaxID=342230 RepID=A0A9W6R6N9_9PSEU|nr:DUF5947 family protein [Amycolatopsis taiwanensis]GLY70064.1 hypothetical protein Atai01_66830 [Amycolatopsis taiwanensis]